MSDRKSAARVRASRPSPAAVPPAQPLHTPHVRTIAAALFGALLIVYLANLRVLGAGDSIPTRLVPFSLLREHNIDLDEFPWERNRKGRWPYYIREVGEHFYSGSPIATPLLLTPLYVPAAWWLSAYEIPYDDVRARLVIVAMERLGAAALTALSASLLFLALVRLATWQWALGLTLVYGLGTTTWAISSQALWPHAMSELALVVLSAIFLARAPSRWALLLAGVTAAVAVANRPPMLGFAALALLYVWRHHHRHVLAFSAVPAIGAVALVAYNLTLFHGLAGGYAVEMKSFSAPLFEGLAGLLFSPNRGLFVYTPIMLFAAWGAVRVWQAPAHPWVRFLVVGLAWHLLVYGKFREWWGGYAYGPRYMTDVLPILIVLLVYGLVPLWKQRAVRAVAIALAVYGVAVQAIGVYCADDDWEREPIPLELRPQRVWAWSDLQIARALRSGFHAADLAPLLLGVFRESVPARLEALFPADLASAVEIVAAPARLTRGETGTAIVRVANRGARSWPAFNGTEHINVRHLVYVMVQWWAAGQPVRGVGDLVKLPRNVAPGDSAQLRVPLVPPPRPGPYEIELRVTQAIDGRHGVPSPDAVRLPVIVE